MGRCTVALVHDSYGPSQQPREEPGPVCSCAHRCGPQRSAKEDARAVIAANNHVPPCVVDVPTHQGREDEAATGVEGSSRKRSTRVASATHVASAMQAESAPGQQVGEL